MSTITKQWLQQKIADMEAARDEIPFGLDEDGSNTLAALRYALASLEAEPVGYIDAEYADLIKSGNIESCSVYAEPGEGCITVFSVPPAPVSVPEWTNEQCLEFLSIAFRHAEIKGDLELDDIRLGLKMANGSRAAMLQGGENAESPSGNSPVIQDGWVMVPVEPTKEMIDAGWSYYMTTKSPSSLGVYGAMLAAAPRQEVKP
jgi:hypothetical protein